MSNSTPACATFGFLQLILAPLIACVLICPALGQDRPISDDERDFFESRIRPVLVDQCYSCHNSTDQDDGGLVLDFRDGLVEGGDSGPAIVPGDPDSSLLLSALLHDSNLRMPKDNARLSDATIQDFKAWIQLGAPDPRDQPPSESELLSAISWEETSARRMQWWSFQPVRAPRLPSASDSSVCNPVDWFIRRRLESKGIEPAPPADRRVLLQRLHYVLTGLPPTADQLQEFLADDSETAYAKVVDELLASAEFGERWARHWMDWVRYAESHGSEGDPSIPQAFQYRDYLIRALNEDVPYDRLVLEHIAGDLIESPRINVAQGWNESKIGLGHFRFVEHGYGPTDALEEQIRFTDNQIDVIGKAFLGLTISCARCHDHKFDPISQADYYAIYGVFNNCRAATINIDSAVVQDSNKGQLQHIKQRIRQELTALWLESVRRFDLPGSAEENKSMLAEAARQITNPLNPWARMLQVQHEEGQQNWGRAWSQICGEFSTSSSRIAERKRLDYPVAWHLGRAGDLDSWFRSGNGLNSSADAHFGSTEAGDFLVNVEGKGVVSKILPAGTYTNLLSSRHGGIFHSAGFEIKHRSLWLRVIGNAARARYVVQNYPRVSGPVYQAHGLNSQEFRWLRSDMEYWKGDRIHVELATGSQIPVEANNAERSWFGIAEVLVVDDGQPAPGDEFAEFVEPLFAKADSIENREQLTAAYHAALTECIRSFGENSMTDGQARFLSYFVVQGILPNQTDASPSLARLVDEYRDLEAGIESPTRAPGIVEAENRDQPLLHRGNHRQAREEVARRYLQAFDATTFPADHSGRLHLANKIVAVDNPLFPRVGANRIWHHVFGRGLVTTPDNFGRLGALPTHPELLDYLAAQWQQDGYSIKQLIRILVTSETFKQSARVSTGTIQSDPDNRLWSRSMIRRMDAESLRDKLLFVAGDLERTMFGASTNGASSRRSIYVRVQRNALDPFLQAFDAPAPYTTKGSRDQTNVPAQSLALLNASLVHQAAANWLVRLRGLTGQSQPAEPADASAVRKMIEQMFADALGREATKAELSAAEELLQRLALQQQRLQEQLAGLQLREQQYTARLAAILNPVRERLLGEISVEDAPAIGSQPISAWEFDSDLRDAVGELHGRAIGDAKLVDGALELNGNAFVMTASSELPLMPARP